LRVGAEKKMTKKYEITVVLFASSKEEAHEIASRTGSEAINIVDVGFVHPDGSVRDCPLPPEGFSLREVTSSYYGCHEERGEGDEVYCFAVPEGTELPDELRLAHGTRRQEVEGAEKVDPRAMAWDGTEWTPARPFLEALKD
jgi:hypothetical protein